MKIIILLFCMFFSANAFAASKNDLAKSNNSFATSLYKQLWGSNENKNIFFSPYSIYNALGMLYAGATEETKKELENIMHIALNVKIHDAIWHLNQSLIQDKPSLLDPAKLF